MKRILLPIITLSIISGCTSLNVQPVAGLDINKDEICIVNNTSVNPDFAPAYLRQIIENGYKAKIINNNEKKQCKVTSEYMATYGFHWGTYLETANLSIYQGGILIGEAIYEVSFASPAKHGRVEGKINTMVDQLLPVR